MDVFLVSVFVVLSQQHGDRVCPLAGLHIFELTVYVLATTWTICVFVENFKSNCYMACMVIERSAIDGQAYLDALIFCGIAQAEVIDEVSEEFFWVKRHSLYFLARVLLADCL
jgi:hypothetical protein